jgi:hypothetical protein
MRTRLLLGALIAIGGLGAYLALSVADKHERGTAETQARKLVLAIERHDAPLAPDADEDWVPGVWAVFRRVDRATLLRVGKRMNGGSALRSSGSDYVADMLLHTARGLVLLELSFESGPKPDLLYELSPDRIPAGLLDARTMTRVESDQRERGTKLADDLTITVAGRTGRDPAAPREDHVVPDLPPLAQCVVAAEHDVKKIQECVRRNG